MYVSYLNKIILLCMLVGFFGDAQDFLYQKLWQLWDTPFSHPSAGAVD